MCDRQPQGATKLFSPASPKVPRCLPLGQLRVLIQGHAVQMEWLAPAVHRRVWGSEPLKLGSRCARCSVRVYPRVQSVGRGGGQLAVAVATLLALHLPTWAVSLLTTSTPTHTPMRTRFKPKRYSTMPPRNAWRLGTLHSLVLWTFVFLQRLGIGTVVVASRTGPTAFTASSTITSTNARRQLQPVGAGEDTGTVAALPEVLSTRTILNQEAIRDLHVSSSYNQVAGQCLKYIPIECLCHQGCLLSGTHKLNYNNGKGAACLEPPASLPIHAAANDPDPGPDSLEAGSGGLAPPLQPHCNPLPVSGTRHKDIALSSLAMCVNANSSLSARAALEYSSALATSPVATNKHGLNTIASLLTHYKDCTGFSNGKFVPQDPENCHQHMVQQRRRRVQEASISQQEDSSIQRESLSSEDGSRSRTDSAPSVSCDNYCCKEEDVRGSWIAGVAEGQHVEQSYGELFEPRTCQLYTYSIREMARELRKKLGSHRVVLMGDSMMRQFYQRLVSLSRGDPHAIDFIQWNHSRYRLFTDHDSLEIQDGSPHQMPSWWEDDSVSADEPSLLLEVIFVWAPRFNDVRREVQEMTDSYTLMSAGGNQVPGTILSVGIWLWHVKNWPKNKVETGEFHTLMSVLDKALKEVIPGPRSAKSGDESPQALLQRLVILDTPTGRMLRLGAKAWVEPVRGRNAELHGWARNGGRGEKAIVIPFDELSTADGHPGGLIMQDWHYACKWDRWSDLYGDIQAPDLPIMEPNAACMMPDEAGGCKDYMNAALWQVMANLLLNGR